MFLTINPQQKTTMRKHRADCSFILNVGLKEKQPLFPIYHERFIKNRDCYFPHQTSGSDKPLYPEPLMMSQVLSDYIRFLSVKWR